MARTSTRVFVSIFLVLILLSLGGLAAWALLAWREEPPRRELSALPPLVETIVIEAQDVVERFAGYGSVRAMREAKAAGEVAATVVERVGDVRAGAGVKRGQVLFRLDDREYQHARDRAQAQADAQAALLDQLEAESVSLDRLIKTAERELRVARDEQSRLADLFERNQASKKEYDFAQLAYQQARRMLQEYERETAMLPARRTQLEATRRSFEAEAALAGLNVARCAIRAPFGGTIQAVLVEVGDRVAPGVVVATLIDSSRVEIPIQLPAGVYDRLTVGATCRVEAESMTGLSWSGQVARIAPSADEASRTLAVYVVVDNTKQPGPLAPGVFVRASVDGPTYKNGLLVPRRALRDGRVFVMEEGVVRLRRVSVKRHIEDWVLVSGELRSGERVILSHLSELIDGSPVRVDEDERTPDPVH